MIEKCQGVRKTLENVSDTKVSSAASAPTFVRNLYKVINLINQSTGVVCVIYTRGNFKGPISFPWDFRIYTLSKLNSLNFPQIRFISGSRYGPDVLNVFDCHCILLRNLGIPRNSGDLLHTNVSVSRYSNSQSTPLMWLNAGVFFQQCKRRGKIDIKICVKNCNIAIACYNKQQALLILSW